MSISYIVQQKCLTTYSSLINSYREIQILSITSFSMFSYRPKAVNLIRWSFLLEFAFGRPETIFLVGEPVLTTDKKINFSRFEIFMALHLKRQETDDPQQKLLLTQTRKCLLQVHLPKSNPFCIDWNREQGALASK